ncbi:IS3 family transposase [Rudanella lutea]|uniref:IS3 family transposase n=1 Tax=Rudanella lutea TaxID=451374 RepID=UPI0012FC9C17
MAESFFKTLKCEMVNHVDFETRHQAKLALFEYIEGWYNLYSSRLNLTNGVQFVSPLLDQKYDDYTG